MIDENCRQDLIVRSAMTSCTAIGLDNVLLLLVTSEGLMHDVWVETIRALLDFRKLPQGYRGVLTGPYSNRTAFRINVTVSRTPAAKHDMSLRVTR